MPARTAVIRPLFYDALSGEFYPQSDTLHRAHTLGRLSLASYLKGDNTEDSYIGRTVKQYVPTWASDVTVKTYWSESGWADVLTRIRLSTLQFGNFDVIDQIGENAIEVLGGSEPYNYWDELTLGNKLDIARDAVTRAADNFFNSNHA